MAADRYEARSASDHRDGWPFWLVMDRQRGVNVTCELVRRFAPDELRAYTFATREAASWLARMANNEQEHGTMDDATKRLRDAALALAEAVSFDVNGIVLPTGFFGGNGGLVSSETLRKADEVRRAAAALEGGNDGQL